MPKKADADAFVRDLIAATAEIDREFFDLPVMYGQPGHTIYRERAYCYELYHRLRLSWRHDIYRLNGELSKAGHPLFAGLEKTPDFLVHVPGFMDNLVIVEVKSATGLTSGTAKDDLFKLTAFVERARYERGVYLIYGGGDPVRRVRGFAQAWTEEQDERSLERVHLLWQQQPGEPARDVGWG